MIDNLKHHALLEENIILTIEIEKPMQSGLYKLTFKDSYNNLEKEIIIEKTGNSSNEREKMVFEEHELEDIASLVFSELQYVSNFCKSKELRKRETETKIEEDTPYGFYKISSKLSSAKPDVEITIERKWENKPNSRSCVIDKLTFYGQEFEDLVKYVNYKLDFIDRFQKEAYKLYSRMKEQDIRVRNLQFAEGIYGK